VLSHSSKDQAHLRGCLREPCGCLQSNIFFEIPAQEPLIYLLLLVCERPQDSGQLELAITNYRTALSINPNQQEAIANLTHTLCFVCNWTTREEDFARLSQLLQMQLAKEIAANNNGGLGGTSPDLNGSSSSVLPAVQPFHSLIYPLSLSELLTIARKYAYKTKSNVSLCELRSFSFRYLFEPCFSINWLTGYGQR
jgi:hypothetical protein